MGSRACSRPTNRMKILLLTKIGAVLCVLDEPGKDEIDEPVVEEEDTELCTYLFIDSRDQLLLNFSPQAIDVLTEVYEVGSIAPPPPELSSSQVFSRPKACRGSMHWLPGLSSTTPQSNEPFARQDTKTLMCPSPHRACFLGSTSAALREPLNVFLEGRKSF